MTMTGGVVASSHFTATGSGVAPAHVNTQVSDGGPNRTVARPTGTGGLLLLTVCLFQHPSPSSGTVTPPTASVLPWTLASFVASPAGTGVATWLFTKPAEAGDAANFTYTSTGTAVYHANSCSRFTHASGAPVVNAAATPVASSTASPQFPAVTTTKADCLLVAYGGCNNRTWSSPADGFVSISAWVSQALYRRSVVAPGTYGPSAVTLSASDTNNTHTLALVEP